MPTNTEQAEFALDLLKVLNLDFEVYPARLEIYFQDRVHRKELWHSPDIYYTLAYALISFIYRGICLANPGSLTAIWPDFWKIFQSLPDPQNQLLSTNAGEQNDQPTRRRIIVSRD
jgi:3-phosphoshikimate 1-carboxyvinyltransferase